MLKHWRQRSGARRVLTLVLSVGALLCSFSAAADGSTATALIGNIQSSSSGSSSSGSTTHFFTSASASTWTVTSGNGICSNPIFVYIVSSQFGYRELLATAMLAKALGKRVSFIGDCTHADYFKTHYVILIE